jgi:hypothetical protein
MPVSRTAVSLALAVAALSAAGGRSAEADETSKACATSFERSQYLLKDGKLQDARVEALACGAAACPAFVREACQKVFADIDVAQPTVVLAAQDAGGGDLVDVRVEVDGQPFLARLGAEAVPVDPGEHTFRFFYTGQAPLEQHTLIRTGEKNRVVRAMFSASATPAQPSLASAPALPETGTRRAPAWPSLVVGGIGLGAIGASIAVGLAAKEDADNLRSSCAPRCHPSDVADVNTRLIVSDVLLATGLITVGVATVLLLVRGGRHEAGPVAWRMGPSSVGSVALPF